jgi:hypothetical protein
MSVYQLLTPWSIGSVCLDAGTLINTDKPTQFWSEAERLAAAHPIPLDVVCLSSQTVREWKRAYHDAANYHQGSYAPWASVRSSLEWWDENDEYRAAVREVVEKILTEPTTQEKVK